MVGQWSAISPFKPLSKPNGVEDGIWKCERVSKSEV